MLSYFPQEATYVSQFQPGKIHPVWRVVPLANVTPADCFACLRTQPYPVLLESVAGPSHTARYSFVAADPFLRVESQQGRGLLLTQGGERRRIADVSPFAYLETLLGRWQGEEGVPLPPFWGGGIGYLSYDFGRYFERIPDTLPDDLALPEMVFSFYDRVIALDHHARLLYLIASPLERDDPWKAYREGMAKLEALWQQVGALWQRKGRSGKQVFTQVATVQRTSPFHTNYEQQAFEAMVLRAKRYIDQGDIFQVNLSHRIDTTFPLSDWELYTRLTKTNAAPFAAYLPGEDFSIISSSPERLISVRGRTATSLPIAGTGPRGRGKDEDAGRRERLQRSEKDHAEHLMLVDLVRNDLGRVCEYGSVQVPHLARIESYTTVFHLVSQVSGTLRSELPTTQVLPAIFPAGTITGAPKVRAMEIIDELENIKRGTYTGSLGYVCFDGSLDFNILIRTFVLKEDQVFVQVGAGIVADSDPEQEYFETLYKAKGLIQAIEQFKTDKPQTTAHLSQR